MKRSHTATLSAIGAAALYALNIPISKLLLRVITPTMMAAFLYLGAGLGLSIVYLISSRVSKRTAESRLTKFDLPYLIGMIVLDIAAPILLMLGLHRTTAEIASLLGNFEIVATSIVALAVFSEVISKRLWISIGLITLSSMLLSIKNIQTISFSAGSLFILAACVCWGFENNCTRKLSSKNTIEIVILKGIFSGLGALVIALVLKERLPAIPYLAAIMLLGFAAFGLSIFLYIRAQRDLGAAKTSVYYAIAPFLGVVFSFILFREMPDVKFFIALVIMVIGTYFSITDTVALQHTHPHEHTHVHAHEHNGVSHIHEHVHEHNHLHAHERNTELVHGHAHTVLENHEHKHEADSCSTKFE